MPQQNKKNQSSEYSYDRIHSWLETVRPKELTQERIHQNYSLSSLDVRQLIEQDDTQLLDIFEHYGCCFNPKVGYFLVRKKYLACELPQLGIHTQKALAMVGGAK